MFSKWMLYAGVNKAKTSSVRIALCPNSTCCVANVWVGHVAHNKDSKKPAPFRKVRQLKVALNCDWFVPEHPKMLNGLWATKKHGPPDVTLLFSHAWSIISLMLRSISACLRSIFSSVWLHTYQMRFEARLLAYYDVFAGFFIRERLCGSWRSGISLFSYENKNES